MPNKTKIHDPVANGVTAAQLRFEHEFAGKDWYQASLELKELLSDTTRSFIY